jgi:SAM-dependent methyltransferase
MHKSALPDLQALKARQQSAWASGNYAIIGTRLQPVGESLCEAVDVRAAELVLDVAAGNGNATLDAARRWCHVTSTDYVPALLDKGQARATAEGLEVTFLTADTEALPFGEATFDVGTARVHKAFAALPEPQQQDLERDLVDLIGSFNCAKDETMMVPSAYLEVVIRRAS